MGIYNDLHLISDLIAFRQFSNKCKFEIDEFCRWASGRCYFAGQVLSDIYRISDNIIVPVYNLFHMLNIRELHIQQSRLRYEVENYEMHQWNRIIIPSIIAAITGIISGVISGYIN